MPSWIQDGCTEPFKFKAVPGLHEGLAGDYRPMCWEESEEFLAAQQGLAPKQANDRLAVMVAERTARWDRTFLVNPEPVPINPANVRRLNRLLFQRLAAVILGVEGHDGADAEVAPGESFRPGA